MTMSWSRSWKTSFIAGEDSSPNLEGSESSDEDFVNKPLLSEPLEPALQESFFQDSIKKKKTQFSEETFEELDLNRPGPSLQRPEPRQQQQATAVPGQQPKRARWLPRKAKAALQPQPDSLDIWVWDEFEADKEYINEEIQFTGEGPGMSEAAERATTELDCFQLFFTTAVVDNLVTQTNLYAQQEGASNSGDGWAEVGREDIFAFFGVAMAISMNQLKDIMEMWTSEVMVNPWFASVMSERRFKQISRYFHIDDNTKAARTPEGNLADKLFKIRPLINSFSTSFKQHFKPNKELSIDEQMIGTKARCSFDQCFKPEPSKRGVKFWALCDARIHYCMEFQIYTGGTRETGLSFRVVNDLMCHYLGKGHHVYFDDFYTSPELMAHLISHNTLAVGTVRHNRINMPECLLTTVRKAVKGQSLFVQSHRMTACRWTDERNVFCLSTVHGNTLKTITRKKAGGRGEDEQVQKPLAICDYNTYMGGVDVHDLLLSSHCRARSYRRWWLKVFWQLFDTAVFNALALWKLKQENVTKACHKQFKLNLIRQLVAPVQERNVPIEPTRVRVPDRLQHYGNPFSYGTRKRCTVCKDENRKTTFGCLHCGEGVRLHFSDGGDDSCFLRYHTAESI